MEESQAGRAEPVVAEGRRVLFLDPQPFFQCRGSPIRVAADVRMLAGAGHRVDLLAMPVGSAVDLPPSVRLLRVPNLFGMRSMAIGPSFRKAVYDVILFFHALVLIARHRYDVIHSIEEAGAIGVVLARLCGARTVFEKHSDPESHKGGFARNLVMRMYRAVERFAIRHSNAVILTGPGMLADVRRMAPGTPVHAISDVPSSIAEADGVGVAAARRDHAPAADDVLATYIGSFAPYQGIDLLFRAIPAALQACPRLRLVVAGGSEAEIERRRGEMTAGGVSDRVRFLGMIPPEAVPNLLRASDILLSPRLSGKNTPLKLLDYLKSGRAVVATDTPANRLILSDETARFAAPDPDAFARAIADLAADADLRDRLGRAGQALAQREYGFDTFRRGLAACYAGLPARRRPRGTLASASSCLLLIDLGELQALCRELLDIAV